MSKRLTIKRVGTLLPVFLLAGFLLIIFVIVWLSTVGLPRFLVEKIETAALEEGIPLKIDKVKLSFAHGTGLVAEGINVYVYEGDTSPVLTVDSASVHAETLPLFIGNVKLKAAQIKGGKISLPVSEGDGKETLNTTAINIAASIHDNYVTLTESDCRLQGVPLHIKGGFSIPDITSGDLAAEEHEKLVIPAMIQGSQNIIDKVYQRIEEQHWSGDEFPEVYLTFNADEEFSMYIRATVPKYDIAQFSFRDAKLNLEYANEKVIVHHLNFHTVNPVTNVQFKGGFELETQKLSFEILSDAALLDMATALTEGEVNTMLGKFRHAPEDAPKIKLSGAIQFGEELRLTSAEVLGIVKQQNLHIGDSIVNDLNLSFYYRNGIFNIDRLTLQLPDGYINFRADTCGGLGSAELTADIAISRVLTLINEFSEQAISIPSDVQLGNNIKLQANAALTVPEFLPGETPSAIFAPNVTSIDARIELEKLAYQQNELVAPVITLSSKGVEGYAKSLLEGMQKCVLQLNATSARLLDSDNQIALTAPSLIVNISDFAHTPETGNLSIENAQVKFKAEEASGTQFTAQNVLLHADAACLKYLDEQFKLQSADVNLTASNANYAQAGCKELGVKARATADASMSLPQAMADMIANVKLDSVSLSGVEQGNLTALFHLPKEREGELYVSFKPTAQADLDAVYLRATPDFSSAEALQLKNIRASLSPADLARLGGALEFELSGFELPESIILGGNLSLNAKDFSLLSLDGHLEIPQLVRTPGKVKALAGKRIPVSINADFVVKTAEASAYNYTVNLSIAHETGKLQADLSGNTATGLKANATCTILPNIVDALIDDEDAHSILRDFAFNNKSRTLLSNIVVDVQYHDGLVIKADCDCTAHDFQYQLNALLDDANGNEIPNKDLVALPYATVRHAKTHVNVDWQSYDDARKDVAKITLSKPFIDYDNRPWLRTQDFRSLGLTKQGPGMTKHQFSELSGDSVIIDVEDYFVKLNNVRGTVYPGYSLGMFYPDLRDYFSLVLIPYPATVSTVECQFPIDGDSKADMKGIIKAASKQLVGLDFLGTTIPMTKFSGVINLSNDYVFLDKMNALCWNGTVDAAIKFGISGKETTLDGQVICKNMDLKQITASYGATMDSALCEGSIRLQSPSLNLKDLRAYGDLRVVNGNLMSLNIFRPIGAFVSDITGNMKELEESARQKKTDNVLKRLSRSTGSAINAIGTGFTKTAQYVPGYNHIFAYDLQNAYISYTIDKGIFHTRKFVADGYNLKVSGRLDIDMDNLTMHGNMWPEVSSLPTVIMSPITFLSDFMLDIVIFGKVDDLKWEFKLDPRINGKDPVTFKDDKSQKSSGGSKQKTNTKKR